MFKFQEKQEESKIEAYEQEDLMAEDQSSQKKGFFTKREDYKKERLERIKKAKERPSVPLMEELQSKPGYKDVKMRKLVQRSEDIAKDASKDDYI